MMLGMSTEHDNAHRFLLRQNDAAVGQAKTRDDAVVQAREFARKHNAEVSIVDASRRIDGVTRRAVATVHPDGRVTEIIFE